MSASAAWFSNAATAQLIEDGQQNESKRPLAPELRWHAAAMGQDYIYHWALPTGNTGKEGEGGCKVRGGDQNEAQSLSITACDTQTYSYLSL